jgi:hypothetical protein
MATRKNHFNRKQHILFTKMSLACYYPPVIFENLVNSFKNTILPDTFNEQTKKSVKVHTTKSGDLYKTTHKIQGYYVTNSHDLFCYLLIYKQRVYVIFRGTNSVKHILNDLHIHGGDVKSLVKYTKPDTEGRLLLDNLLEFGGDPIIFPGFVKMLLGSIEIINELLVKLMKQVNRETNKKVEVYITGQSLGGAIATVFGFSTIFGIITKTNKLKNLIKFPLNVCSLGAPKVGNGSFIKLYNSYIKLNLIRFDRVVSQSTKTGFIDTITQLPPPLPGHIRQYHKKHAGFSEKQLINCHDTYRYLLKSERGENYKDVHKLESTLVKLCINHLKYGELKHPFGKVNYNLTVQETEDVNRECHKWTGIGCHGHYFTINFMNVPKEIVLRTPAYRLFKIKKFETLWNKL